MDIGKKWLVIGSLIVTTIIGVACFDGRISVEDEKEKDAALVEIITGVLESSHYRPLEINDDFSKKAFASYIEYLDPGKRYLLEEDFEKLKNYELLIDDEIKNGQFDLLNVSNEMISKRYEEAWEVCQVLLEKPFDFTVNEKVEFDEEKLDYPKNKKELKERWRLMLKYQILTRIDDKLEINQQKKEDGDSTYVEMTFEEAEEKSREAVLKSQKDLHQRLEQLNYKDRRRMFINAFVNLYDPHTSYFPPKDKENFDIGMSGQLEGIGATLQSKDGYIKVIQIVPGSASWKQGELSEGDVILKVGQAEEEPVDIVNMRLDEAVQLIRGPKGSEVRLTVKKIDGQIKTIPIIRDVVIIEAGYAKSAIIEKDGKKLGIIHLPKFYADFNKANGRSCAKDVAKEVMNLKKDGVDGILLDLRNNGGGSLQDVIDMVGYFIPEGPVVQVKARYMPARVMEDNDGGETLYDGPLLVMVNEYSASASEILAAAIKDYGRGVIIGSSATFGKGTVQRFVDLNRWVKGADDFGAIKLTTQKFYRINGGSTQLKGVEPDVVLPDRYMFFDVGEREFEEAMEWDEIKRRKYDAWSGKPEIDGIVASSKSRIDTSFIFQLIEDNAKWLKKRSDESSYHLSYEKYKSELDKREEELEKYDTLNNYRNELEFTFNSEDQVMLSKDSANQDRYDNWVKGMKKDPYLLESFHVFKEMVK